MVPTVNDVRLTGADDANPWPRGPNPASGYQLDARFATLQEQATGAFISHAEVGSLPSQQMLDDLAAFQLTLFTTPRVRELADAVDAGTVPLPDTDPPLTEFEEQGKAVFVRACAHCHGGPRSVDDAAARGRAVPRHLHAALVHGCGPSRSGPAVGAAGVSAARGGMIVR